MKIGLLFCLILIIGCQSSDKPPSLDSIFDQSLQAIATTEALQAVESISTLADCLSPNGAYATEVQSYKDDYCYFKQTFSYRPEVFEAVILDTNTIFQIMPDSNKTEPLDKNVIAFIKGHEFHELILDIKKRYSSLGNLQKTTFNDKPCYKVEAIDFIGDPCELYFDESSKRMEGISFQNPGNIEEIITITFSDWQKIDNILLPDKVHIDQSGKIFTFDYKEVIINKPTFQKKDIQPN